MTVELNATNIILLASVIGALVTIVKYVQILVEKANEPSKRLDEHEKKITNIETEQKMLLRSNLAMMNHMIDGNHTNDLKQTRDDFEKYLINK